MEPTQIALRLEALGNATRLEIYRLLVRAGTKGLNFGSIQKVVGLPNSTLSHHVATLARSHLIVQERHGREVISRVDSQALREVIDFLNEQRSILPVSSENAA